MSSSHSTCCVYSAVRCGSGENWINIGMALPHRDGQGFDILLQALPLNSKLVLRDCSNSQLQASQAAETGRRSGGHRLLSLREQVDAFERALIEQCLLECGGRISAVMERLDVPRRTLSEKMTRLGINRAGLMKGASANGAAVERHTTAYGRVERTAVNTTAASMSSRRSPTASPKARLLSRSESG